MKDECPKCRTLNPENCHSMQCPMRSAPTVATDSSGDEQVSYTEQIEFVKAAFQYYVGYEGLDGFNKFLKESKFQITRKN